MPSSGPTQRDRAIRRLLDLLRLALVRAADWPLRGQRAALQRSEPEQRRRFPGLRALGERAPADGARLEPVGVLAGSRYASR